MTNRLLLTLLAVVLLASLGAAPALADGESKDDGKQAFLHQLQKGKAPAGEGESTASLDFFCEGSCYPWDPLCHMSCSCSGDPACCYDGCNSCCVGG